MNPEMNDKVSLLYLSDGVAKHYIVIFLNFTPDNLLSFLIYSLSILFNMKLKIIALSLILIGFTSNSFAQNFSKLKELRMTQPKDYAKAEKSVTACCKYLLNNPLTKEKEKRDIAANFMFQWMQGTPDYTFELDETVAELSKINQIILPVYMAAITQYTLEHKLKKADTKVKEYAIKQVSTYCENPKNGVEMTDALRNWIMKNREDIPLQLI